MRREEVQESNQLYKKKRRNFQSSNQHDYKRVKQCKVKDMICNKKINKNLDNIYN